MFFLVKRVFLSCDDCGYSVELNISSVSASRKFGWAISKNYKKCYCPNCAPRRRNVGLSPNKKRYKI